MPDSSLAQIDHDRNLASSVVFRVLEGKSTAGSSIEFQFAPKIISESNNSSWEEHDIWAIELLRIHKGSIGKKISMEWEYIATDTKFSPQFISDQLRILKSYFYQFEEDVYPIIVVKFTEVIPIETHFRLRDINVQYGPELITKGNAAYPLYTKVNVTLELATTGELKGGGGTAGAGASVMEASGAHKKVNVDPLKDVVPQWY